MKSFTKVLFLVGIIVPLPVFYSIYLTEYLKYPVAQTAWVSWYDDPQHEVYIGWETTLPTTSRIDYGLNPSDLNWSLTDNSETAFHCLNLTALMPDTKYYYQVISNDLVYTNGSFTTAPASPETFQFVLTSDTQQKVGPGWYGQFADIMDTKEYAFLSMVGDMVEEGWKEEWNNFLGVSAKYFDTIPFVPVQGNHDKPRGDTYYFKDYFHNSVNEGDPFYYSFNWSNVHFQILFFPEVDLDDGVGNTRDYDRAFTPEHLAWLEEDLGNAQDLPFKISLFHCPITGSGFYGPNEVMISEVLPILHHYNVTATISGHAHHYERGTLPNSEFPDSPLTYFVVGTGGGLADVGLRPVNSTDFTTASPSYTEVTANPTQLVFNTYDFANHLLDTITLSAPEGYSL